MKKTIIIGSRGSQLALWQANHIATKVRQRGIQSHIEVIRTTGDKLQSASLVKEGGKGLFTKEIEEALLAGVIDLAVHSLKDLPTQSTAGLTIAAIPDREDPRDVLVGCRLEDLPSGGRVGTSSNRRATQLRLLRSDILVEPVRGNVDTRLRKLGEGQFDALMLAAAGLHRLGLEGHIRQYLEPEEICPAPGQGALALQTRVEDEAALLCRELNDPDTAASVNCERAVLAGLGGGCELPIGVYAFVDQEQLHVIAGVFSSRELQSVRAHGEGIATDPVLLGKRIAHELIDRGAHKLLAIRPDE